MNAAPGSAPSRRIAASSAAPLHVGHAASSPRHSQRYGYGAGIRATSTSHSRNGSLYGSRADAERASRVLPWYDGARAMMRCLRGFPASIQYRSEEHTSELQSQSNLVCRLLLEKKK